MRNLTITREKSFVGCAMKMKIYLEDTQSGTLEINGVPCRELGRLKNGEMQTFVIGDEAARVFVIADQLSKKFCNDFYQIPAGTEDVVLSGKARWNPATGNAFWFNGVTDQEVLENRKKGTRRGIAVLCGALVLGLAIGLGVGMGWFSGGNTPKTFTSDDFQITLTQEFQEMEMTGYNACYGTEDAVVFALKEEFELYDGLDAYTLEQYGELVIANNGLEGTATLETVESLSCFEYQYSGIDEEEYHYFVTLFKTDDAF